MRIVRITFCIALEPAMKPATLPPASKPATPRHPVIEPRPLDSAALFGAGDEVRITHGSETYRLRRTRQGKLILTK
jgi:hemin uptake protein HemP